LDSSTQPRHSRRLTDQPWVACLRERAQLLEHIPALEHRRSHLLEKSQKRSGASRHVLDRAYDLSQEEGLDPVLALELVGCGVAVVEFTPPEPSDEAHSLAPEFVEPMDEPLSEILLERRMRQTFRRMRAALEQTEDLAGAIDHFAREPDVCPFDYDAGSRI
jgi:hypothetical protein